MTKEGRFLWAAVLAGGYSRRMQGPDKQFLEENGKTLSIRVLEDLADVFPRRILVSNVPEAYRIADGSLRVVRDILPGFGPLSGLHAALAACEGEWLYLAACDEPFFSPEWARFLAERIEAAESGGGVPQACAASDGRHMEPFHALYSRKLVPVIDRLLRGASPGRRAPSLSDLLGRVPCLEIPRAEVLRFSPDWSLFFNINTPADWDAYREYRLSFLERTGRPLLRTWREGREPDSKVSKAPGMESLPEGEELVQK